jgi:glyoxalase family protein
LKVKSFSIPEISLDYWMKRLGKFGIPYKEPQQRFGDEAYIYFEDPDGLEIIQKLKEKEKRKGNSSIIENLDYNIG